MAAEPDVGSGTWVTRAGGRPAAMRVRKCRLEVIAGPSAPAAIELAQPQIVIGRAGADLVLDDRKVSALHAEIRLEDGGYRLRDLGSTNGTRVWGMRVVEGFIGPGTTITLGESAVRFLPLAESVELPLWQDDRLGAMVGGSPPMRRLFDHIVRVAPSDTTVLVTGETGTGKELVAEAIHDRSSRADQPFVVLDCGAIPAQLFEAQLFGHEAGAFTGARGASAGLFEAAHGGTLFLDEIGELPLDVQPKLLRAVESRKVRRLGGTTQIECDVRLIAATNRDLAAEVNRGAFRSDLYYRIAVARLHVPALRERTGDIPRLIEQFAGELAGGNATLPADFVDWASRQPWPGNVRELRNAVERGLTLVDAPMPDPADDAALAPTIDLSVPFKEAKRALVDAFDRRYLTALLDAHDGNISAAARAAGLDRMSIYKMLQRLGIRSGTQ